MNPAFRGVDDVTRKDPLFSAVVTRRGGSSVHEFRGRGPRLPS